MEIKMIAVINLPVFLFAVLISPGSSVSYHPEMALFPMRLRSPRAYFLDVRKVRLFVTPCAALLIEKIAHFQIENYFVPV